MSAEGFNFDPRPEQLKFPVLIMRAYVSDGNFAEWILTPPEGGGWFEYKFDARQENGMLYINFDQSMMMPKAG